KIADRSSPPASSPVARTAIPSSTGTAASVPSATRLRGRRNTSRSSEASSRADARTPPPAPASAADPAGDSSSAVDIEPLPRQAHEHVLQARPDRGEPAYGHARVHQAGDDPFRRQ